MVDLSKLSGPKLDKLIELRSQRDHVATNDAIAAGYGHVRFNEMRELAAAGDLVATNVVSTWNATKEARDELDARKRYHGSNKPIRRANDIHG